MADVQLEHGYLRIANSLLEAILRTPLSGSQIRVLFGIIRLTYGFNQIERRLSSTQIADVVEMEGSAVRRVCRQLEELGMIRRDGSGPTTAPMTSIRKDFDKWKPVFREPKGAAQLGLFGHKGETDRGAATTRSSVRDGPSSIKTNRKTRSVGRRLSRGQAPNCLSPETIDELNTEFAGKRVDVSKTSEIALDYFRGEGKPKADWKAVVRNWIRRDLASHDQSPPPPRGGGGNRKPVSKPEGWTEQWDN